VSTGLATGKEASNAPFFPATASELSAGNFPFSTFKVTPWQSGPHQQKRNLKINIVSDLKQAPLTGLSSHIATPRKFLFQSTGMFASW
jgi:hypothetical protein